jgi:MFS family permease
VRRGFWLLWWSSLVSQLGGWLLVVAVPAQVFTLTGSVTATGLALAAQFLPPAVLGPFAGLLADRWDRRHVMATAQVISAAAVGLLLFVHSPADIWLVYAALITESVGTVIFRPAAQAHTPVVVGTGKALSSANALFGGAQGLVRLIGGPLGGFLYAWAGFTVLVRLDMAAYLVSAVLVLCTVRSAGRLDAATFGFALTGVRGLLVVNMLFLAGNASLTALLVPFGMTVLGGAEPTGFLMSALGVGFLLGAPLLRALVDRVAPSALIGAALALTAVGYVVLFSATTMRIALAAATLIGLAGSVALGGGSTMVQRTTPNEVLGRVSAVLVTGEAVATLAGALAGGPLAQRLSISGTAVVAAGVTLAGGAIAARFLPRTRPAVSPVE